MSLISCIFVTHQAIACLNSLAGSPALDCIDVEGVTLCVDNRGDLGCYQDIFTQEVEAGLLVLDIIKVLNSECSE